MRNGISKSKGKSKKNMRKSKGKSNMVKVVVIVKVTVRVRVIGACWEVPEGDAFLQGVNELDVFPGRGTLPLGCTGS